MPLQIFQNGVVKVQPGTLELPYDNTAGFTMGIALVNLTKGSTPVTAAIWDDRGTLIGTQNLGPIAGNGHMSFVLPSLIPLTAGKRGVVLFDIGSNSGIAGLGLRFSPFSTFTSVPAIPPLLSLIHI